MPLDAWRHVYDVNVTGVFLSCQAEARVMLPRGTGSIINIASIAGVTPIPLAEGLARTFAAPQ